MYSAREGEREKEKQRHVGGPTTSGLDGLDLHPGQSHIKGAGEINQIGRKRSYVYREEPQ